MIALKPVAKRILFLTGTRADFGKLKPLISIVDSDSDFESQLFVTGMHTLERYGCTVNEVRAAGFRNVYVYVNQFLGEPMDLVLANTIHGLGRYIHDSMPDLIVVHGDRIEALAGSIVGAIRNVRTAHIEGGELSGTVDGLIRHSISKLAHTHFVANNDAAQRLIQMGERPETVYVIGSPDIDVMYSSALPELAMVLNRYEIGFDQYAIAIFHPVTTDAERLSLHIRNFVDALLESRLNYVCIFPNNDEGTLVILKEYERLADHPRIRLLPSLRFEYFLTLLRNALLITGNSSAGIREAPVYGVPAVNVGTRQQGRHSTPSIIHVGNETHEIVAGIRRASSTGRMEPAAYFGHGNSAPLFLEALRKETFWSHDRQKAFFELPQLQGVA